MTGFHLPNDYPAESWNRREARGCQLVPIPTIDRFRCKRWEAAPAAGWPVPPISRFFAKSWNRISGPTGRFLLPSIFSRGVGIASTARWRAANRSSLPHNRSCHPVLASAQKQPPTADAHVPTKRGLHPWRPRSHKRRLPGGPRFSTKGGCQSAAYIPHKNQHASRGFPYTKMKPLIASGNNIKKVATPHWCRS